MSMPLNHLLLLVVGIPSTGDFPTMTTHYENYHRGLLTAQAEKKPLLVILNPGPQYEGDALTVEHLRKTRERRGLLTNYVVVVINATSPHGEIVYRAYGKPKLPHVVVLDNRQSYQLFSTSEQMYGQRWTEILTMHQKGNYTPVVRAGVSSYCPYCQ